MSDSDASVQVIANLVIHDGNHKVLLVQTNPDTERWWLPGQDVEPFTHPDAAADNTIQQLNCSVKRGPEFKRVQSFRGRRGWHLIFDYLVLAQPQTSTSAGWFTVDDLPRTMHGDWERNVIDELLGS